MPNEFNIKQVVVNLTKIGIGTTEYGGMVAIQVSVQERSLILTIKDSGKGMSKRIKELKIDRIV